MKTLFISICVFLYLGCKVNPQKESEECSVVGQISLESFYNKHVSKQFELEEPNSLHDYIILSFDLLGSSLYIPNSLKGGISIYDVSNKKIVLKDNVRTKNKVDFVAVNEHTMTYANCRKNSIYTIRENKEIPVMSEVSCNYKTNQDKIIYTSKFWFYTSAGNDSFYYQNIYTDWDYWYNDKLGYLFFSLDHQGDKGAYIKNSNKIIYIDSSSNYDTYKILGTNKQNIVLFMGNDKDLEILTLESSSLEIINRKKVKNPFKSELIMGDAALYWPNQFIAVLKQEKIYLLGTTRKCIEVFSIDI